MSGWPARPPCHRIPGYDPRRAWPRACAPPPRRARGRTPEARRPPAPPAPCPGPTPASGAGPHRCHSAHSGADTPHTVQRHPGPAVPARPAPGRVRRTRHPPRPSSPHPAGHAIPWRCARRSPFICSGPLAAQNLCENGVLPQAAPDGTHGWVRRAKFLAHFELRKVALGSCGRDFGTPCAHENACVRCPLLRVDHTQMPRLEEIRANLLDRLQEAKDQGWLGEVAAIQTTLAAADQKLVAMRSLATTEINTHLGMPGFRSAVGTVEPTARLA